jgi:hypothetical protein
MRNRLADSEPRSGLEARGRPPDWLLQSPEETDFEDKAGLAQAVRAGLVAPPRDPRGGPPDRLPVAPFARLLRELEEDRARR